MALSPSLQREIGSSGYGSTAYGGGLGTTWDISEPTPELMWPLSVYVYDRMRRQDSQCIAVKRAIALPIVGAAWRLDPNGADDAVVRFVADNLGMRILGDDRDASPRRQRDRFSWGEHVKSSLLHLDYGHMPFEQVYRIEGSGAGQRAMLRKLAPRMPGTLASIDVADDGGLQGIRQFVATGREQPIGVERLVMYVNDREGGAWSGMSIYRGAYKHWLLKDRLMRVGAMTVERNGMGVPFFEAAQGSIDADLERLNTLARNWRAGDTAGGAVPAGTKIHLKGVDGTLPDALPQIRWHSEEIAKSSLAMFLNLGTTQTGARALGESFIDFFQLSIDTVSQYIADTATDHVVEDLVDINFGETVGAPKIVVAPTEAETDASPEQLVALATAKLLQPDAMLEGYLRDRYRLPQADPTSRVVLDTAPSVAAGRSRQPRPRRVSAAVGDEPADPTSLPEPLGTIYQRRLDLEAQQNTSLGPVLTDWADTTDLTSIVDAVGIVQADTAQPVNPAQTAAEAAAVEALTAALDSTPVRQVARDGLAESYAEGTAGAGQLVAVTTGQVGVDLEAMTVAFDDALAAAADLDWLWSEADAWIADHIGVTSRAVGDAVGRALAGQMSRSELLRELRAVVGDADKAAVLYDHALASALDQGALDLYHAEGVEQVEILTAGDSRVDEICRAFEEHGPYDLGDTPELPAHVGCRCAAAPADESIRKLLTA